MALFPGRDRETARIHHVGVLPRRVGFLVCAFLALAPGSAKAGQIDIPFDPSDFPNPPRPITNQYWPLSLLPASAVYFAQTQDECSFNKVTFTGQKRTVAGVKTWVIRDQEWVTPVTEDGECDLSEPAVLTEDTEDYLAQDNVGNIRYFGERTWAQEDGVCSSEGTWLAGEVPEGGTEQAESGIIMLADPHVGDRYKQEFAEDVAEDMAKVLRADASVSIWLGEFTQCLKTGEWTPLSPGQEHKYYCFDQFGGPAGLVFIEELKGKTTYVQWIGEDLPEGGTFPGDLRPFPQICGP